MKEEVGLLTGVAFGTAAGILFPKGDYKESLGAGSIHSGVLYAINDDFGAYAAVGYLPTYTASSELGNRASIPDYAGKSARKAKQGLFDSREKVHEIYSGLLNSDEVLESVETFTEPENPIDLDKSDYNIERKMD